jgi:ferric-dicitrate binding protein FerR (iron transport regulator)
MMRPIACSRLWQAAAIEDGRLDGPDRASFRQHALSCAACAHEVGSLAELRRLAELAPVLSSTPLEHRRLRAALLRRADDQMVGGERRVWRSRWTLASAAALVVMLVLWIGVRATRPWRTAGGASPAPAFEVTGIDHASWTVEATGRTARVRLAAGSAAFHVERTTENQRFLLSLPDGEIEVHGTRFLVELAEHTTRHVEVSEGVVTLRLADADEVRLVAGDTWDRTSKQPLAELEVAAPAPAVSTLPVTAPRVAPSSRSGSVRGVTPESDMFAAAMTAFRAGDFRRAEHLFEKFLELTPGDPLVEDAHFLRAVARSRSGDADGAAKLAKEYLRKFPDGLRRREAEKIATPQGAR